MTDGTSNTAAICQSTLEVFHGTCPLWDRRAWVHAGIDLETGISTWHVLTLTPPVFGTLGS